MAQIYSLSKGIGFSPTAEMQTYFLVNLTVTPTPYQTNIYLHYPEGSRQQALVV